MIRRPPRSTLFPTRRSSDLHEIAAKASGSFEGKNLLGVVLNRVESDIGYGGYYYRYPAGGEAKKKEGRSEEHTSELQSQSKIVCRLLLEKKKIRVNSHIE